MSGDPAVPRGEPAASLVLASASPRRRELLARAGVAFEAVPAGIPEEPRPGEAPRALAERLAREKAVAVARRLGPEPPRWVLGADTVVVLDGESLGKPRDPEHAVALLRRLVGCRHEVVTGFALAPTRGGPPRVRSVVSRVTLRRAEEAELRAYVATGEPMDKAGAYAAQGLGRRLVARIEGSETNVIGLPMEETLALLREVAVPAGGTEPAGEADPAAPGGGAPDAISARIASVRRRIAAAAHRAGRDPGEVTLIGVSKRIPVEAVVAAVRGGLRDLGESYVQEAVAKIPAVAARLPEEAAAAIHWHGVGRLQRNKARQAAELFHAVHSVDRPALARELARRAAARGRRLSVLLQVDLCDEPQKGGVAPEALEALLEACAELPALEVAGLMTLPAATADPEAARPVFARLRRLRDALARHPGGAGLRHLSMGMSGDFEVAVEEGATLVRVGTAIFGPRPGPGPGRGAGERDAAGGG